VALATLPQFQIDLMVCRDLGIHHGQGFIFAAPSVSPATRGNDILATFTEHPTLHAVTVVDEEGPVGLINRRTLVDAYALP
jgi:CBS domain-containing protein